MTRILLLLIVVANAGCLNVQPLGPLADMMPARAPQPRDDGAPEPIVRQAGKPTPPALYVTPGEITNANAVEAAKRLQQELETDRRSLEAMPKYSEVSNPK